MKKILTSVRTNMVPMSKARKQSTAEERDENKIREKKVGEKTHRRADMRTFNGAHLARERSPQLGVYQRGLTTAQSASR